MKRFLITLGMMVAATLSLTNCTVKENFGSEIPEEMLGQNFSFIASAVDTKTVNDDLNTNWVVNDSVSVFHAQAGTTSYVKDNGFGISEEDLAARKFRGTLGSELDSEVSYDWYMIYPYTKAIQTPANTGNGFNVIGSKNNETQTQNGINSKAHLAGANMPLIGKAKAVAAGTVPEVTFSQVASVIAVEVTNSLSEALTVKNVAVRSKENLVGSYYINFAGDEISFMNSGTYQSRIAKLTVVDGVVAAGAKAVFYIAVKPFAASEASTLDVAVNNYVKTITVPAGTEFKSGKIKTVCISIDSSLSSYDWEKVTASDQLAAGDVIIVANSSAQKAISTTQNNNNRGAADVVIDGNYLAPSDTTELVTLVAGAEAGTFGFRTSTLGYLSAVSSSSNNMRTIDTLSANGSFQITYTSGKASLKTVGSFTRNLLQFNPSNKLFSLYGSAQNNGDVDIYKRVTKLSPMGELTVTGTVSGNVASISWNALSAAKDYTVTSSLETKTVTGTSTTVTLPWNGETTVTVTANPSNSTQYKSSTGSISLTVGENPSVGVKTIADLNSIVAGFTADGSFSSSLIGTKYEGYIAGNNANGNLKNMLAVVDKDATGAGHGAIVFGYYLDPAIYPVGKKISLTIRDSSSVAVYYGLPEVKGLEIKLDDAAATQIAAVEVPAASMSKDYAGMYVKVSGVKYAAEGWSMWNGTKSFTNGSASVDIRTNSTAVWASEYISPETTSGSISGVVTVYNSSVQIQPLGTDDVEDFDFTNKAVVATSVAALTWDATSTDAKTLNATVLNSGLADITLSTLTNFTAEVTSVSEKKAVITVTPKAENTGTAKIEEVLTITAGNYSRTVSLSQAKPGVVSKVLEFSFSSPVTGWERNTSDATAGNHVYSKDGVDYTFTFTKTGNGIYCNSAYLMVTKNETLGLPAIEGYVLTKIVATNSSGCSKSVSVSVKDGNSTVAGAQTWSTQSTAYTYDITNGTANTSYGIAVSSAANCQIVKIQLTYTPVD